jgi:hypothetical protein
MLPNTFIWVRGNRRKYPVPKSAGEGEERMKLQMLGLAAVAAMALMAFLGAGSASATVLCKQA